MMSRRLTLAEARELRDALIAIVAECEARNAREDARA
jgi:hypothetical protein